MKKASKLFAAALIGAALVPAAFAADLSTDKNYTTKCASCHGAKAEGKPAMKVAPLADAASKSESDLVNAITNGKASKPMSMPAFKGKLTDADIKALATEIKALKK